jgi:hypothetical protein
MPHISAVELTRISAYGLFRSRTSGGLNHDIQPFAALYLRRIAAYF